MADREAFNDEPICEPSDDQFGIDAFATALAHRFMNLKAPNGATIALNGPWGSGKSSAANLVRHHLRANTDNDDLVVIEFKCWWFQGQEALTLAFLQELDAALEKSLNEKAKNLLGKIGRKLLSASPVIGPAVNILTASPTGTAISGAMDFASKFFSDEGSLEEAFTELRELLENQKSRYLIIIDDIDRLTPDEAIQIFRLIKSVGQLPNIMYLLVFDRELAERTVKERYPSEGSHFLEKIIQASFEIPIPKREEINRATMVEIERICGTPTTEEGKKRLWNVFYDAIAPYINVPRDVVRLSNSMSVTWPTVANEVNIADFVALEVMRLKETALYNRVRHNIDNVCGHGSASYNDDKGLGVDHFLLSVIDTRRERAKGALTRLFPRLSGTNYGSDFEAVWERQRLVCSKKHFDSYFKFSIGDDVLPLAEVKDLIDQSGNKDILKKKFLDALKTKRRNGKSLVPLLFEEVTVRADEIPDANVPTLVEALFEISDEIDIDTDRERGMYTTGNNRLRIHWLIRKLTLERLTLQERSNMFVATCAKASLGWLVDFTSSAMAEHFAEEGKQPTPPERCLVLPDAVEGLIFLAVNALEKSANDGTLASRDDMPIILFRWLNFIKNDNSRILAWTSERLDDDEMVAQFAKAFTTEAWSHSESDRIAVPRVRADVDALEKILDVEKFRSRLEDIEKTGSLSEPQATDVNIFLNAWRRRESGEDDWLL